MKISEFEPKKYVIVKITSIILQIIKLVNKAFGIQLFCIVLVLLLFGVITVFSFITSADIEAFPMIRIILVLFYVHFVLYEIAYYGHSTYHEIKEIHGLMRRLYSKAPKEENSVFLDVNLEVSKYSCGLITFDWEIFKMVAFI
ncbi:hypothetical protein ACKWTF_006545 [Chironomus riparius]